MTKMDKRLYSIDCSKGIAILLVVLGHVGFAGGISWGIYSFHMPLFFIMSGLFLCDKKGKILKLFQRLMVPYFIFGMLYIIIDFVTTYSSTNAKIQKVASIMYGNQFVFGDNNIVGTLWFLPALFLGEIEAILVGKIIKNKIAQVVVAFTISIISMSILQKITLRLPYGLEISATCMAFIVFGKELKHLILNTAIKWNLCELVIGILGSIVNHRYFNPERITDLLFHYYGCPFLFIISSTLISCAIIGIINNVYKSGVRLYTLEKIGKVSLIIMAIHIYFLRSIKNIYIPYISNDFNLIIIFIATSIVSFGVLYALDYFFPWIIDFGKFLKKGK